MVTITFTRPLFSVLALQKIGERIVVFTKEDVSLLQQERITQGTEEAMHPPSQDYI